MITYEYLEEGRLIKHIYFANKLSYEDFKKEVQSCDELSIYYFKELDNKIYQEFGNTIIYMSKGSNWHSINKSIMINLDKDEREILDSFHKNRRYKVKRAIERDDLKIEINKAPNVDDLLNAEKYYNLFANSKGLAKFSLDRYNSAKIKDCLWLASVKNTKGDILALNGYLIDYDNRVSTFAFGASHFRMNREQSALIGRANSYLHYAVMCNLRASGFRGYDFGGLYEGDDESLNHISDFKRSFGGTVIEYAPKFTFQKKDLENVEYNLLNLKRIVNKKNIIVWGYSTWGKYIVNRLKNIYGIMPACIIDNGIKNNTEIKQSCVLSCYKPDENFLIVTTRMNNYKTIIEDINVKKFLELNSILCIREEIL